MPTCKKTVDVLVATYNGGAFLDGLFTSFQQQSHDCWQLIFNDDCSTDQSVELIRKHGKNSPDKITLLTPDHLKRGACDSFNRLLEASTADYVMFCDQDDIWSPTKIEKTLSAMLALEKQHGKATPLLVHTDLQVTTNNLDVISESLWKYQNIHPRGREKFNRLLVQNVVSGCTVMINKPLRDLALPISDGAVMHDWWLALVASAFGKIGHVDQSTMFYRQHGSNEIGAKDWGLHFVLKTSLDRGGRVREAILKTQRQARVFLETYQDKLPADLKVAAECYAYIDQQPHFKKVYLLLKYRMFKAGLIRNLGLWSHI